ASCTVAKYRASGGVINGLLYVVGGGPGGSPSSRTDVYDPLSDSWAPRAAMPSARSDAGSAVLNGILYVIGGEGDQGVLSSVEAYNPLMDTWAEKAPLPVALGYSPGMAATFNGRIYVAGGHNAADNELSNAVYVYDTTSDSWSAVSTMP